MEQGRVPALNQLAEFNWRCWVARWAFTEDGLLQFGHSNDPGRI